MRASARGWYGAACRAAVIPLLERRRKDGRLTILKRLEESQWWPPDRVRDESNRRLRKMVGHAVATTGCYADRFREAGIDPGAVRSIEDLAGLPMLTRQDIRRHFDDLTSSAVPPSERTLNATGGSTGEPLTLWQDRQRDEANMADRYRTQRWAGWNLGEKSLTLWGAPTDLRKALSWPARIKRNLLMRDLMLDAWSLGQAALEEYARILRSYRPILVAGYASALSLFARHLLRTGTPAVGVRGVVSSAETLFPRDREWIEEGLQARVFNRYATRDVGGISHECEAHGDLHIHAEGVIVEVVRDGRPVPPGVEGDLLITTLTNRAMPLIRYAIGDRGTLSDRPCPCGRGLPLMRIAEGRVSDYIETPSGRRISGVLFPHLFKDYPQIVRGQVVQESPAHLRIDVVLVPGAALASLTALHAQLRDILSEELQVHMTQVEAIPTTPSGKYRFVVPLRVAAGEST